MRAVVVEGTACGAMTAVSWRLQIENMGSGGQSSIFVSGTTLVSGIRFGAFQLLGHFHS